MMLKESRRATMTEKWLLIILGFSVFSNWCCVMLFILAVYMDEKEIRIPRLKSKKKIKAYHPQDDEEKLMLETEHEPEFD